MRQAKAAGANWPPFLLRCCFVSVPACVIVAVKQYSRVGIFPNVHQEHNMTTRLSFFVLSAALALASAPSFIQAASAKPAATLSLQKIDTKPGTGRLAMKGDTVTIHYIGWLYAPKSGNLRGPEFEKSTDGAPVSFKLGAGAVIKGWDEGIRGMKVGGKRTLIVPASMAFGKKGAGKIPATANLVFDIELTDVK